MGGEKHGDGNNQVVVANEVKDSFSSAHNTTPNTTNGVWGYVLASVEMVQIIGNRPVGSTVDLKTEKLLTEEVWRDGSR